MEELVDKLREKDLDRAKREKFRRRAYKVRVRGTVWSLKFYDVAWSLQCPVLGIDLDYYSDKQSDNSPMLTMLDPAKGYIKDNVIVISWRAHRLTADGTSLEHRQIATFLEKYL